MINKQMLADGFLQIAIALSFMRTDLNNVLNVHWNNQHISSEIHEVGLGSTSAYTQSNFHHHVLGNDFISPYPNLKHNVDVLHAEDILHDLHQLGTYRRFNGLDTNIGAWLVNEPPLHALQSEHSSASGQSGDTPSHTTTAINPSDNEMSHEESHSQSGSHSVALHRIPPELRQYFGDDLTKEDMDLIDILWQQDIDLGVLREDYSINESEQNAEPSQEHNTLELLKKIEDLEKQTESSHEDQNTTDVAQPGYKHEVDDETGETICVPITIEEERSVDEEDRSADAAELADLPPMQQDKVLDIEEAMKILEEQTSCLSSNNNCASLTPDAKFGNHSDMIEELNDLMKQQEQHMNSVDPLELRNSQDFSFDDDSDSSLSSEFEFLRPNSITHGVNNIFDLSGANAGQANPVFQPAESSFTYTFEGLNAMLPMGENQSSISPLPPNESSLSVNHSSQVVAPILPPNTSSLFSYASLPENQTAFFAGFNTSQPGAMFPDVNMTVGDPFNNQGTTVLEPNCSLVPGHNQEQQADSTPLSLEDILDLNDEGLHDIDYTDASVNKSSFTGAIRNLDDGGSDSAVSGMEGSVSSYQDLNETSNFSDQFSPFEDLQGAVGGSNFSFDNEPKYSIVKSEPSTRFNPFTPSYAPQSSRRTNASMTNSSDSFSSSYYPYYHPDLSNVNHNHSYNAKPGEQPKVPKFVTKAEIKKEREEAAGPSLSKDEKRLRTLGIPLTLKDIIDSPVERFNELLTDSDLSEEHQQVVRDIRRRGKNKVAAQNCRKRKIDNILSLDDNVTAQQGEKSHLLEEREFLKRQVEEAHFKYQRMCDEILASLRDDNGQPYDPSRFTLQQSDDGNVFVVPVNSTSSATSRSMSTPRPKNARKKKGKK